MYIYNLLVTLLFCKIAILQIVICIISLFDSSEDIQSFKKPFSIKILSIITYAIMFGHFNDKHVIFLSELIL